MAGERERALLSRALHAVDRVDAPCRLGLARHPESDQQEGEHDPLVTQFDDHGGVRMPRAAWTSELGR